MTARQASQPERTLDDGMLVSRRSQTGCQLDSFARTMTESDIVGFAGLTGDFDPLHVDHDTRRADSLRQADCHGLLGLSFMAGLSSTSPRVRTLALVRVEDWQFSSACFAGDTLACCHASRNHHTKGPT